MSDFEHIKDRIDFRQYAEQHLIVKNKKALCLFHADKNPSMHIYDDSFHCFQCGATGDIFDLHMKLHNISKQDALVELARYAGVTLEPLSAEHKAKQDKRERLYALMEDSAKLFEQWLWGPVGENALRYLREERGLSDTTIKHARMGLSDVQGGNALCSGNLIHMGYSDNEQMAAGMAKRTDDGRMYDTFRNRIVMPIRDAKGRIVAFSGRALDKGQAPKYLHNATSDIFEKSKIVHRMPVNRSTIDFKASDTFVIVEGTIDPISALNRSIYNVVSIMGTSLSDEQLTLLCSSGVTRLVFALDNDAAGQTALRRLVEKHMHTAAEIGVDLYAMTIPHGKDADDTLREKPELWQAAVDSARPVVDVLLERESVALAKDPTPGQKQVWGLKVLPLLRGLNGFVNEDNLNKLAVYLNTTIATIDAWTRSQIHIMPKANFLPVQRIETHLPSNEEWALHAILVNDDDGWLERANARLDTVTIDPLPHALAPLSLNDFMDKHMRMVMSQIIRLVSEGERPLHETVKNYFQGGNNSEIYERIEATETRSRILGGPGALDYESFIRVVFEVRMARLTRDIAESKDDELKRECSMGIALLSLALEELPI